MYIKQLTVTNYRSLRNIKVGDLSPFTVFFGQNDSGKSNILTFLELVFKTKGSKGIFQDVLDTGRPGVFWRGIIENFYDNFFMNHNEPINFSIQIQFTREEIKKIHSLPKAFIDILPSNNRYDHLKFDGEIISETKDLAKMNLLKVEFNRKNFYSLDASGGTEHLSDFSIPKGEKLTTFECIMGTLENSFLRIPANRYFTSELEMARDNKANLISSSFKNWLFQNSLDRDNEIIFKKICDQFNHEPFKHGRISVARIYNKEIEIFIEDKNGLKLPLSHKGSGVQQVLMILSHVAQSNSPMIGIEELEINLSPPTQKSLFNNLKELVSSKDNPISQILLTTHSYNLAKRNDVQRRCVWIDDGETKIKKPSEANLNDFFVGG